MPIGAIGGVQWSSSDPGIVAVDAHGGLHAMARGWATITATANGSSAQANVRVFDTHGSRDRAAQYGVRAPGL